MVSCTETTVFSVKFTLPPPRILVHVPLIYGFCKGVFLSIYVNITVKIDFTESSCQRQLYLQGDRNKWSMYKNSRGGEYCILYNKAYSTVLP